MKKTQHVVHSHPYALLIIDMLNPLNFPGSEKLLKLALPAAKAIALEQMQKVFGIKIPLSTKISLNKSSSH